MAGFAYRKNLDGSSQSPTVLEVLGNNSVVFQKGDAIRINTSGVALLATETSTIAGFVDGVVDKNGGRVDTDSGTNDTWTMASDNTTVAQKKVRFIPALANYLFYNDTDGTLAQTNLFQFADLLNENQVKQSTLTDNNSATVRLIELDPDHDGDASKGLFQVVESQFAQVSVTVAG